MLDQALAAFELIPHFNLKFMKPRQTLIGLTARALTALDMVMRRMRPNLVMVQGDTTSAMVGALAAYYHRVTVAHLEAGLRTGDLFQPFPEEGNRRLISNLTALHFPPTSYAARRLQRESVPARQIVVTGNTVIDALRHVRNHAQPDTVSVPPAGHRRVLLTMHRRESFGRPLENICRAVLKLVERNADVEVVFPAHGRTAKCEPVERLLGNHPRIALSEPMGYQAFVQLLDSCYLVMTDSGGVQEEAPALGKPVLVLRDKTERMESVKAGTSRLVGTNTQRIVGAAEALLHKKTTYSEMASAENPFGDGRAAERVVAALRFHFGLTTGLPASFAPCVRAQHLPGAAV